MGKKSAPPPPDYAAAAREQGAANKEAALQTAVLSNPNIYTPYGSQTVSWGYPSQQPTPFNYQQHGTGAILPSTPQFGVQGNMGGVGDIPAIDPSIFQSNGPTYDGGDYWKTIGQQGPVSTGGFGSGKTTQPPGYAGPVGRLGERVKQSIANTQAWNYNNSVGAIPQPTVVQQFSPTEQAKYDANSNLELSLLDTAQGGLGRVNQMMDTPFDTSQMQQVNPLTQDGGQAGFDTQGLQGYRNVDTSQLPQQGQIDMSQVGQGGNLNFNGLPSGDLNTQGLQGFQGIDRNALSPMGSLSRDGLDPYTVQASVGGLNSVADAIRARGDEDFTRRRRELEADLAARGFTPGSEGYNAVMQDIDRQQNDYNQQALLSAGQEQSRIANLEMARRGQNFGEMQNVADFAQRARAQGFSEQQIQAEVNNRIREQQFNERAGVAQFAEQQRTARGGERIQGAQFAESQAARQFQQQEAVAQFQQQLRAQGLSEQQVQAQVNNAIRAQQFGERGAMAQFDQSEMQRRYQNDLQRQQAQQAERERQMQEQAYLRQLPLNEINALRTGAQAQLPQFQGYTGANVGAAPIFDAAAALGNYNMSAYQSQPDVMGGLFQLGGAAMNPLFGAGGIFNK